jgi:hypothetical protein
MGQFASVEGEVEVLAVPGFSLTLTPGRVEVHTKDMDMVARFKVGVVRDAGYEKPVYLLMAGTSIGEFSFQGVPITVPGKDYALVNVGIAEVDLQMDMTDMSPIKIPFSVAGFEDAPEA